MARPEILRVRVRGEFHDPFDDDIDWAAFRQGVESQLEVVVVDEIPAKKRCWDLRNAATKDLHHERARERSKRNSSGGRRRRKHGGRR